MQALKKEKKQGIVLVLFGSPRKEGFTARLLEKYLKNLGGNYDVKTVNAYDLRIEPCLGCGYCEKQDGCPLRDFDEIDRLLHMADLLVIATPIYYLSMPAPLKAIIDRTQRYFSARFSRGIRPPISKHKEAVLLLTCGAESGDGADIIRRQVQMALTVLNAELREEILWKGTDHCADITPLLAEIKKASEQMQDRLPILAISKNL